MEPSKVEALFDYTGKHTDELNFRKGDIITITQPADGGWCEGTLRGVTGWFPANYVAECRRPTADVVVAGTAENRATVVSDIIDTEAAFVKDLDLLINSKLPCVWTIFKGDYDALNRSLELILETHRTLLSALRTEANQEPSKIGKLFLLMFPRLQSVYHNFCKLHSKSIKLLMESGSLGTSQNNNSNSLALSAGLSSPFKRLERYEALLGELTRHTAENHLDRGDSQRSFNLFRELSQDLTHLRRQKQIETEILRANIRNWDGPPISTLGDVRVTCPVTAYWQNGQKDHYLIVFDSVIILVSLFNSTDFQLDCKFPLEQTTVTTMADHPQWLEVVCHNTRVVLAFSSMDNIDEVRSRVDVYSTVVKRHSARSADGATSRTSVCQRSTSPRSPNAMITSSRPISPDPHEDKDALATATQKSSRPTSPAPLDTSGLLRSQASSSKATSGSPVDSHKSLNSQPASSEHIGHSQSVNISLMTSRICGVLPHRRVKVPLQREPVPGLKRGSSARKNKKELPLPILPPDEPTLSPTQYEKDLQILKAVESFANFSKKLQQKTVQSIPLPSLPSVRVSTVTSNNSTPADYQCQNFLNKRPMSYLASSSNSAQQSASLKNLQNDVTTLKEQMSKLQTELQEERRQRKALQDQLNLITSAKRA